MVLSLFFVVILLNFFLSKTHENVILRAVILASNMHRIVFRMRLCPGPHWETYSAPQTLNWV